MVHLTEEMKAQLMKVTGISDMSEFDSLVKQHAPEIPDFDQSLKNHSPFDLQLVLFREQIENKGINNYESKTSIEEKMKYVYETLIQDADFQQVENLCLKIKSKKDIEKSKKLRDLGNKNFQSKVNEEAIRYYNESVLAAPIKDGVSQEAALGLGNRSVVLFNLSEYEKCLSDISAALLFGYPRNLQYKVYERQGKCYQALGNYSSAKQSFEKALEMLKVGKVAENKKPEIESDLKKSVEEVSGECDNQPLALVKKDKYKIWNPHKQFPNMLESVSIEYREDVGRHGVATENIAPGDLILVEDPVSWTVNVGEFENICQQCMKSVGRTPVPSPDHETALFCCYNCLKQFQEKFRFNDLPLVELFSTGAAESSASAMLAFR